MIAVVTCAIALAAVAIWVLRPDEPARARRADDRTELVFWGHPQIGDEIYTLLHDFERKHPQYKVTMGSAVAHDITGDAQRLLMRDRRRRAAGRRLVRPLRHRRMGRPRCADRPDAATSRSSRRTIRYRIDPSQYYPWALEEASYKPPGSPRETRAKIFGIPSEADVRIFYANANLLRQAGYVDAKTGEPVLPKNWDELHEYAKRLTRFKVPNDKTSGIARLGFAPNVGNAWLYLYAWQAGGEFLDPTRTRCTLDCAGKRPRSFAG